MQLRLVLLAFAGVSLFTSAAAQSFTVTTIAGELGEATVTGSVR